MVENSELVNGRGTRAAKAETIQASAPLVSNIRLGPSVPRASRFTTAPTSAIAGLCSTNA